MLNTNSIMIFLHLVSISSKFDFSSSITTKFKICFSLLDIDPCCRSYVNKPRIVEELKDNIREEIAAIPAEMLAKTMENAAKRAQNAINARGGHLRDTIFKN